MTSRVLRLLSGASLLMLGAIASAQTNPLYDHRRSVAGGDSAKSFLEESFVVHADVGRVTLGTPSSHLIDAGVKSGTPILVDLGTMTLRAHVAFRDELDRAARYLAETQRTETTDPGPILVIDREDPMQPIVLDTTAGDASIYLDVHPGLTAAVRPAAERNRQLRRGE